MAMDGDAMGKAISAAVQAAAKKDGANPDTVWIAAANEIVKHIQGNAQVLPGIALTASGSMGAVTGATTAPGTIS